MMEQRHNAPSRPQRRRQHAIRVYVDDAELSTITGSASAARMSESSFLRALGLGYVPKSKLDQTAVLDLIHAAGDQGRLGGLLKKWLSDRPGEGASEHEVAVLLKSLLETQQRLKDAIQRL